MKKAEASAKYHVGLRFVSDDVPLGVIRSGELSTQNVPEFYTYIVWANFAEFKISIKIIILLNKAFVLLQSRFEKKKTFSVY